MATIAEKFVIALGLDVSEFTKGLNDALKAASAAGDTAQQASAESNAKADNAAAKAGEGTEQAKKQTSELQKQMAEAGKQFDDLGTKWSKAIKGFALNIAAPITAAFAIWKGITGYANQVGQVAQMTGAYSTKLEEWRLKRAMLSRVTREDIELYKRSRESVVGFQIAMQDLTAKIARQFAPALEWGLDLLDSITKWISANKDNLARFFAVAATTITTLFLPALIKMGAAMLANPITWIVAAIGALILVLDDLVTYMHGGESALSGFWSLFGTGEEISKALSGALQWLLDLFELFAPAILPVAGAFAGLKLVTTIFDLIGAGVLKVISVLKVLGAVVMAHPLLAILALIISAVGLLVNAWEKGGGTIGGMLDYLHDKAAAVLEPLGAFGDFLLAGYDVALTVLGGILNAGGKLIDWFSELLAKIQEAGNFWDALKVAAQFVFDSIKGLASDLWQGIKSAFSRGADAAINLIKELFNAWLEQVTANLALIGDFISDVVAFFASLPGRIVDALASLGSYLAGLFSNAFNTVYELITSWLAGLPQTFIDAFTGIVDGIKALFASAWDWIVSLFDPSKLLDKAADAAKGAVSKFKSFFGFGDEEEPKAPDSAQTDVPVEYEYNPDDFVVESKPRDSGFESFDEYADEEPEPQPSNGLMDWANKQPDFEPGATTPTQNIQNSVSNQAINNTSNANNSASVQQTNNITINANSQDAQGIQQALSQEMALQNDKLQRQTMAIESGTRT